MTPQPKNERIGHCFIVVLVGPGCVAAAPQWPPQGPGAWPPGEGLCGGGRACRRPHGLQPQGEGVLLGGGAGEDREGGGQVQGPPLQGVVWPLGTLGSSGTCYTVTT